MVPTINNEITQVSSEVNIWRVYPGTKHNFYKFFYGNYCVFLEVPGINMDLIELKSKKLIIEKLAMSKAIAKWHLTDHHLRGSYPSTDHNDYAFNIDMKSIGPSFANLERLYKTAKKGDIIIVPQGNAYGSKLLIGEICSEFRDHDLISHAIFGDNKIPYRQIRWINCKHYRRNLSSSLYQELSGRRAVKPISVEIFGQEIFRLAYGNFISDQGSQYELYGKKYKNDSMSLIPGINVINFALTVGAIIERGDLFLLEHLDYEELINHDIRLQGLENFEISFSSPGGFRIWHKNPRVLLSTLAVLSFIGGGGGAVAVKAFNTQGGTMKTNHSGIIDNNGNHIDTNKYEPAFETLERRKHIKKKAETDYNIARKNIGLK